MSGHRVVVIGGGFGGLSVAGGLKRVPAEVTLIDRRNHHLFQPLLYQVATTVLATSEIAWPIRHLFRERPEVRTLLGEVVGVDVAARTVALASGTRIPYDTLVLATGSTHAYFGHDEWAVVAPGLKTLEDATTIRRRILLAFEQAELDPDRERRAALLTFVIVGAGPTGVELAGTIAELAHDTLTGEFRTFDTASARVILVEAGPRILAGFDEKLADYAQCTLEKLGVDVRLNAAVTDCTREGVRIGETFIPSRTIVWAAGVEASPAGKWVGAPTDKAGRIVVEKDLTVPGHPEIFAVGDTAAVKTPDGEPVPGIAPAAKQQGRYVADVIAARLNGRTPPGPFAYRHQGSLATIGKRAAIIDFGRLKLKGAIAWWIWGIAHIYFLIGARSRFTVALNWLWIYLWGHRSARLITQRDALTGVPPEGEETTAVHEPPPGSPPVVQEPRHGA
jgi:NADH dehydrogenase